MFMAFFALPLSEETYQYGWSKWSHWSNWSTCPVTCGTAMQIRERLQTPCLAIKRDDCPGPASEVEVKACGTDLCKTSLNVAFNKFHSIQGKKNCWRVHHNSKIAGSAGHIRDFYNINSQQGCQEKCQKEAGCCSASFNGKGCWLYRHGNVMSNKAGWTALTNVCQPCTYTPAQGYHQQAAHAQCGKPYHSFTDRKRIATYRGPGRTCDHAVNKHLNPDWSGGNKWYRFTSGAGNHMLTTPRPDYSCGTNAAIYLQTPHPAVKDGIVAGTACGTWQNKIYQTCHTVKIVNCQNFFLYYLPPTNWCSGRYCGSNAALH